MSTQHGKETASIRIIVAEVGKPPRIETIPDDHDVIERIIGGPMMPELLSGAVVSWIEANRREEKLTGLLFFLSEEEGLPVNPYNPHDALGWELATGTVVIVRNDLNDGSLVDLTDEDIFFLL